MCILRKIETLIDELPALNQTHGEDYCSRQWNNTIGELNEFVHQLPEAMEDGFVNLFRTRLLGRIHESEFAKYVYDKPRGYPGDYVTQEMIWNSRAGFQANHAGSTEAGKLMNAFNLQLPNCKANCFRINMLKDRVMKANGASIASIGCGSCIELWELPNATLKNISFLGIDQDEGAIESARKHLNCTGDNIRFHQDNILKFVLRKNKSTVLGKRDLIYMMGLIDYFSANSARRIIKGLWETVKPGGTFIFSNAHPKNPTRIWMEYGGQWVLNYKDKQDMFAIIKGLDDVKDVDYLMDDYQVYQYIIMHKK